MAVAAIPAKELFQLVQINQREEDKKSGYQRVLSPGRPFAIAKFVNEGNPLPTNIVIALEANKVKMRGASIAIDDTGNAGWVIDGQHRLAGAFEAGIEIVLPVTIFIGLSLEDQIRQFVTINREARRVPTSLYYDLLPDLVNNTKNETESSKERAVDLANEMKVDESSPFFNRIVALKPPAKGQISLTNFVRKVAPLTHKKTGILRSFTVREQRSILENYFNALQDVFPRAYDQKPSIFFQTVGFGGLLNAFVDVHDQTIKRTRDSLQRDDFRDTLKLVSDFDFDSWRLFGTGSSAEIMAGKGLSDSLLSAVGPVDENTGRIKV